MTNNRSNKGRAEGEEAKLDRELYFGDSYFADTQLYSLSAQIAQIHKLGAQRILEIGKGNGFVSDFLSKAGHDVTTIDINPNLDPDVVGDIRELNEHFSPGEFDLTVCAEVLEHMPFEYFEGTIEQIALSTRNRAFITIPRCQHILLDFACLIKIPKLRRKLRSLTLTLPKKDIWSGHHWELDSDKKTKKREIRKLLEKHFIVESFERFKLNPYHFFIVLKKRD